MKQQQRAQETRSRILEAAEERFALEGYDVTGVAEICQAAGVSKGAFYHHFSSKQEVYLELLNVWLEEMDKQLLVLGKATGNVPGRLLSMSKVVRVVLHAAEEQLPIYLEFWTRAMRDPQILREMTEPFQRYGEYFAGMIEEGISEGTLRSIDAEVGARVIISLAVGLLFQGILDPEGADWDQVSKQGVQILLEGLMKR